MPCKICGREGPTNERELCDSCAAKLATLSESSSTFRDKLSATIAAGAGVESNPDEAAEQDGAARSRTASQVLIEFGQSDKFALSHPFSVATDHAANIFVMDRPARDVYRVSQFSSDGEYLRTVVECTKGDGANQLKLPKGIAVDQHGNIYVPDSGNSRIQRFDSSGAPLGPIGGQGDGPGELDFPCDVDVDDVGALYVADTYNCRIQKLTPQGVQLLSIGGDHDAPEDAPQFDEPMGITVDAERNIFVADTNNHRVVKLDRQGKLLLTFGSHGTDKGQFTGPSDIRVTGDGTIYVADMDNSRVQKFDAAGNVKAEFALSAGGEFSDRGGDVAIDSDGLLIICHADRHTIAKVEFFDSEPRPPGVKK